MIQLSLRLKMTNWSASEALAAARSFMPNQAATRAAIIGLTSAVAAYGAFFIPKMYGSSISLTGGPEAALWVFLAFYVTCGLVTWGFYTRRGGALYEIEHLRAPAPPVPAE